MCPLLTDLATTVLSMPISLFPLVNAERFGGNPRTLGLFLTAIAAGGVAASLLSGTVTRLARPGPVMLASPAASYPGSAVGDGCAGAGPLSWSLGFSQIRR